MNPSNLATLIDAAAINCQPIEQLSHHETFSVDEAYDIQRLSIEQRLARGEKLIGLKMGFTSEAKMQQMGVHDMIWGRLTNTMLIENGAAVDLGKFIHPRAEPEICFRVKENINRELSVEECIAVTDGIASAIEVIDSRYLNFKFSLEDVIADNCSSSALVIGEWTSPRRNLGNLGMNLLVNGEVSQAGNSQAILGDPWRSLAAATRLAHQYGQTIAAGSVIMAGAATEAMFLKSGQQVSVDIESLGTASFLVR